MPQGSNRAGGATFFASPPPRVFAHRGFAVDAPENTLLAFAKAMALGVQFIETDVHESSDGMAIISHDETLERVAARKANVNHLTAAELRRIDLGAGQGFASLSDALEAFPDARFNIDVKSAGAILPTVKAITMANAIDRVLVTSFSDARRRATIKDLPVVATSASLGAMVRVLSASKFRLTGKAKAMLTEFDAVQVPERWKGARIVNRRLIRLAHDAGVEVHVWTVNDPDDMHRLLDLGVDGIVTDRADLAVGVIRSRS